MTTGWAAGGPLTGWGFGGGKGVIAPRPLWDSSQPRPWGSWASSAGSAGAGDAGTVGEPWARTGSVLSGVAGRSHTEPLQVASPGRGSVLGGPVTGSMPSDGCPPGSVDTGPTDGS
ncbi:hypothetical protein [Paractinoplanes brasiliensis]|uniref:hypothetical protein n=1 Tax=Paractinoplanes brasiliensis TaxID=52695 RepID=UPI00194496AA|nr:hypothetical protein [Actinoplanes brasiliensis]